MEKYNYEKTANYCYKGTDVLINKLNIPNVEDLFNAERFLVSLRIAAFNDNPVKGNFDFEYLKSIHKYLFQDIYIWAGDIRNCNISKQDLFCLSDYIENYAKEIFYKLKEEKYFIEYDNETTLEKLVELFADINALHPFREGNGRSQRVFIEMLAKINGVYLDLTSVSKKDMIIASHDSINGNYEKLRNMFKSNSHFLNDKERKKYIELYCSIDIKKIVED